MPKIKLKEWADKHGLSYLTANRHFHAGMIPGASQLDSGTILVEDDSLENTMVGATSNDAMSLFLKKTVEFSKSNSSVEDFAAYVISNFQLKLNVGPEGPRYSRNKPKAEDVQKHFQQFIPKGEKPKPNSFVMEPDTFDELAAKSDLTPKDLVNEIQREVTGVAAAIDGRLYTESSLDEFSTSDAYVPSIMAQGNFTAEGTVNRSVDLNTTPQQINYTGSTNHAFSSFSSSLISGDAGTTFSTTAAMPVAAGGASAYVVSNNSGVLAFNNSFQPTQKELQTVSKVMETTDQLPRRRGRKPSKNKR